ncbi:MAG: hypothetical protein QOG05_4116, partial [Streptosporangiaceae bacterium]|nr:hypothetical protein [Streptosporangiaceae bacterium]
TSGLNLGHFAPRAEPQLPEQIGVAGQEREVRMGVRIGVPPTMPHPARSAISLPASTEMEER